MYSPIVDDSSSEDSSDNLLSISEGKLLMESSSEDESGESWHSTEMVRNIYCRLPCTDDLPEFNNIMLDDKEDPGEQNCAVDLSSDSDVVFLDAVRSSAKKKIGETILVSSDDSDASNDAASLPSFSLPLLVPEAKDLVVDRAESTKSGESRGIATNVTVKDSITTRSMRF